MYGKGTREFEAYVSNLHKANRAQSIGSQLGAGNLAHNRGPMVHNPYMATVAEQNIYHNRAADLMRMDAR